MKRRHGYSSLKDDDERGNNEVNLDYFRPPLTHHDFFSLTDTWFQVGSSALFGAYGLLYTIHFFKEAAMPLQVLKPFACGLNYIDFLSRTMIHIYNIVELSRSHREKKLKIGREVIDIFTSSVLVTGTTLALLSLPGIHVLTGVVAVACAPLASLTPALCSIVMGLIELSKCYKAYQRTKLPVLFRDRLKKYLQSGEVLEEGKNHGETHCKELEIERVAMLAQSLAIARIGFEKGEISKEQLSALRTQLNLEKDALLSMEELMKQPDYVDREMLSFVITRQKSIARQHAFNGSFWLLLGIGVTLAAVATSFFPPLLAPAILVIGIAIAVETAEIFEIDKRIHNCFSGEKNQKTIKRDNPLINFLARRKKEKKIRCEYEADAYRTLVLVPERDSEGSKISSENRVKMRLAFELSMTQCSKQGVTEGQFYDQVLELSWWQRWKFLNRAMDKHVERGAVFTCRFAKGLRQEDKDYYAAQQLRKNYTLFGKPEKHHDKDPIAKAAAKNGRKYMKNVDERRTIRIIPFST